MTMTLQQMREAAGGLSSFSDEELVQATYPQFQRYYPKFEDYAKTVGYDTGDNFKRGLGIAGRNTLAAGGGVAALAADAVGATGARDAALGYAQRQSSLAQQAGRRSDDVDNFSEDPGAFLAAGLGQAVGYAAPSLLGGGAGVVGAARLGLSKLGGAAAGGYAANFGQEAGGIYNELAEQGRYEPGRAAGFGAMAAALDTVPEMVGVGRALKGSTGGLVRRVATGAAKGALAETPTEVVQTGIERQGAYKELTGEDAERDYRNAAALGALGGGAFGAATGLKRRAENVPVPTLEEAPDLLNPGQRSLFGFNPKSDPDLVPSEFALEPPVLPGASQPTEQGAFDFSAPAEPDFRQGEMFNRHGGVASVNYEPEPFVPEFGTSAGATPGAQEGLAFDAPDAAPPGGKSLGLAPRPENQYDFVNGQYGESRAGAVPADSATAPAQDTRTQDMFSATPTAQVQAGRQYTPTSIMSQIVGMTGDKTKDAFTLKTAIGLSRAIGTPNAPATFLAEQKANLDLALKKLDKQVDGESNKLTPEQYAEKRAVIERRQMAVMAAEQVAGQYDRAMTNAYADEAAVRGGAPTKIGAAPAPSQGTEEQMRERNAAAQQRGATADTDARVQAAEQSRAQGERKALLDKVLNDPSTRNPVGRFTAELKRAGITDANLTAEEADRVGKFEDAREAFTQPAASEPVGPAPSAPNTLDPYRKSKAAKEAPDAGTGTGRPDGVRAADTGDAQGSAPVVRSELPGGGADPAPRAPVSRAAERPRAAAPASRGAPAALKEAVPADTPAQERLKKIKKLLVKAVDAADRSALENAAKYIERKEAEVPAPRGQARLQVEYQAAAEDLARVKKQVENSRLPAGTNAARKQQEAYTAAEMRLDAAKRALEKAPKAKADAAPTAPSAALASMVNGPKVAPSAAPAKTETKVTKRALKPRVDAAKRGLQDAINSRTASVAFKREALDNLESIDDPVFTDTVEDLLREVQRVEEFLAQDATNFHLDRTERQGSGPAAAVQFEADIRGLSAEDLARYIARTSPGMLTKVIAMRVASRIRTLGDAGVAVDVRVASEERDPFLRPEASGSATLVSKNGLPRVQVVLGGASRKRSGMNAETALHELIHAATSATLRGLKNPAASAFATPEIRAAAADLDALLEGVVSHIRNRFNSNETLYPLEQAWLDDKTNTFNNVDELLAWGLTNARAQAYLKTVPYKGKGVWSSLVTALRKLLGLGKNAETAFDELLRVSDELLSTDPTDTANMAKARAASGGLQEAPAEQVSNEFNIPEPNEHGQMKSFLNTTTAWLSSWRDRPGSLGWLTKQQLGDRFEFVKPYERLSALMESMQKSISNDLYRTILPWQNMDAEHGKHLGKAMLSATILQAHPDTAWESKANDHLRTNDAYQTEQNKAEFEKLKSTYEAMTPRAKEIYREARDKGKKLWDMQAEARADAIKDTYLDALKGNFTDARLTEMVRAPTAAKKYLKSDEGKEALAGMSIAAKRALRNMVDQADATYEEAGKLQGPYFPLVRNGDHVVVVKSGALRKAQGDFVAARDVLQKLYDADPPTTEKESEAFDQEVEEARKEVQTAKFALDVLKSKDAHYGVWFFEHRWEADSYATQPDFKAYAEKHGLQVAQEQRAQHQRSFDSATPAFMKALSAKLAHTMPKADAGRVHDAIREVYLMSMPDRSALKGELARLNVPGARATQMMRGFASRGSSMAHSIARMKYGAKVQDEIDKLRRSSERDEVIVGNELTLRVLRDMSPPKPNSVVAALSQVSNIAFLGLSPAYTLTNMTQPWVISLPIMAARHGWSASARALGDASAEVAKIIKVARDSERDAQREDGASVLRASVASWRFDIQPEKLGKTPAEVQMLNELFNYGRIDITIEHDMGSVAAGVDKNWLESASEFASTPAHVVEMVNRVATALAAFRLQQRKDASEGKKNLQKSIDYANQTVADTHLDYSAGNAPRLMRSDSLGGLGRLVFQFKKYAQGMLFLQFKLGKDMFRDIRANGVTNAWTKGEALKGWVYLNGMIMGVAGAGGLPLAGVVGPVAKLLAQAWDDDDEPDLYQQFYNGLKDAVGETVAQGLMKGMPAALGADFSGTLGQSTILNPLAYADTSKDGRDLLANLALAAAGPSAALMANYLDAAKVSASDPARAWELVLPRFARDPVVAWNRSERGIVSRGGDSLVPQEELGSVQLMAKALLGIESPDVGDMYDQRSSLAKAKANLNQTRGDLIRRAVEARRSGDSESVDEAIQGFNERNPRMRITQKTVSEALTRRRATAGAASGVRLKPRDADVLDQVGL